MNTTTEEVHGIVGIFDALGAKNFGSAQVSSYIRSQELVLKAVDDKASGQSASRNLAKPKIFTFNDTIIIALDTEAYNEYNAIKGFAKIVRRFISYSLSKSLFFRGAFSIGSYIASDEHNLIMGNAVTDAASWYEQVELIGAVATPKASMIIHQHALQDSKPPDFLLFEADIPCKQGSRKLYAVNWPKAFYVRGLRPPKCEKGQELACLLRLLVTNEVPFGTELKYKHTVDFFTNAPNQETDNDNT
ncbi:MAG: hypothetical protein AB7F94_16800 [Nitrospira sp.]